MSKPITEWTDEEMVNNVRQWEIDSVADTNNFVGRSLSDVNVSALVIKGLVDDNRFLLGVVSELCKRLLSF